MKSDSQYSLDHRVIFRETFESIQGIAKNGGVSTNVTIGATGANFDGNSSHINYPYLKDLHMQANGVSQITYRSICTPLAFSSIAQRSYILNSGIFGFASPNIIGYYTDGFYFTTPFNIVLGQTYEVVYIYQYTLAIGRADYLYINGQQCSINSAGFAPWAPLAFNSIGHSSLYYYKGSVSLLEIYNTVLTSQEILGLYNKTLYNQFNPNIIDYTPVCFNGNGTANVQVANNS